METITKKHLVQAVQAKIGSRYPTVPVSFIADVADQWMEEVQIAVEAGNRIEIRGFGVFLPKSRNARKARNPKTGESVDVPASRTVTFQVGKDFKLRLNKPQ